MSGWICSRSNQVRQCLLTHRNCNKRYSCACARVESLKTAMQQRRVGAPVSEKCSILENQPQQKEQEKICKAKKRRRVSERGEECDRKLDMSRVSCSDGTSVDDGILYSCCWSSSHRVSANTLKNQRKRVIFHHSGRGSGKLRVGRLCCDYKAGG